MPTEKLKSWFRGQTDWNLFDWFISYYHLSCRKRINGKPEIPI